MLDWLPLPPLPTLQGERVVLREPRDSDVDDRLRRAPTVRQPLPWS